MMLSAACGDGDGVTSPDNAGTLQLAATSYDAAEGTIVNVRVTRTGGNEGIVSVDYATADGDAVGGSDYTASSGTLTWADGLSGNKTISITITDDDQAEPSENFTVTLSNVSVATLGASTSAVVHIIDND